MKVKICGLTRLEDIEIVNKYLPDYIGFVFANSKRQIDYKKASELKSILDRRIKAVGVFVDENIENVINLCNDGIIDIVQLHGNENNNYINSLKAVTNVEIIKAVRVKERTEILIAQNLPCDILLLDTYSEKANGGTGRTFNYSLIPALEKPFFLAGGLDVDNVEAAIKTSAMCLDVSSGVEKNGIKSEKKIHEFIERIRNYV